MNPRSRPSSLPAVPQGVVIESPDRPGPPASGGATGGLAVALATVAGVGFAPVAPGTFGSLAALVVFVILSPLSPILLAVLVGGLLLVGAWSADVAGARFGRTDDGRIVIDELVGQLIALAPLLVLPVCAGAQTAGAPGCGPGRTAFQVPVVTGFVLFRLFDIWKPGAVRWAERNVPGGWGVMMDDVLAGLLAAAVLAGALLLAPLAASSGAPA